MFGSRRKKTWVGSAGRVLDLIFHNTVRSVRKTHANAFMAIGLNILQTVILVGSFYILFTVLGMRGSAIRGDFILFIMSGIFLYLMHVRTVQAVFSTEGPSSPMMLHAPMTTFVAIASNALAALYTQVLSAILVLYAYHVIIEPIEIHNWKGALGMVCLSWFSGVGVGVMFLGLKPWFPRGASTAQSIYSRASMIASGKMFVANQLPGYMIDWFDWNPLFHIIDQTRGFVFINYFPRHSSLTYPFYVSLALMMIGLMGEFYTRQNASLSWGARR
ncbi:ABC transporter permease [Palleronia sp.]|uniref:ABC transporter permease n=1 Tax=Palleronia sp. TaxID=1940284 RepID=UPI0035C7E382